MKAICFTILLVLLSYCTSAQIFQGKIYDSIATLKNIKVTNISKGKLVYSDDDGNFSIHASINDTIIFNSLFYNEQILFIRENHLNQIIVIELKATTNALSEVSLTAIKRKDIETITQEAETQLKNQINQDMINNPHLYGLSPSTNMDFIEIFKLIGKLFKKKKKNH